MVLSLFLLIFYFTWCVSSATHWRGDSSLSLPGLYRLTAKEAKLLHDGVLPISDYYDHMRVSVQKSQNVDGRPITRKE